MKTPSVSEIKEQLKAIPQKQLVEYCIRLAKYKKENKELLTYLIFEENDIEGYIRSAKEEIDEVFTEVNMTNAYFAKKTLRKILRIANRRIRYTGNKTAEVEILMHYCAKFKEMPLKWEKSQVLVNIYNSQLNKIKAAIATMHEDLQYDYLKETVRLES